MEHLVRVTYGSTIASTVTKRDLKQILRTSQQNNLRNDISGLLAFNKNTFFQMLEGPRRLVNHTLARIYSDKRHSGIMLIQVTDIANATFPEWAMMWLGVESTADDELNMKLNEWQAHDGKTIELALVNKGLKLLEIPCPPEDAVVLI